MWSVWLLFCDFDFHSVCPLMDKDKRFMEDSWWERLTAGKTESWILLNIHWKDWCWSWSSNTLATWYEDLDAGKVWRQEKGPTEDEVVGWHHRLNRHEFEQVPGHGEGEGSLVCCSPWSLKESDMTERLIATATRLLKNVENNLLFSIMSLDGDLESIMACWLSLSQVFFIWICFTKGLNTHRMQFTILAFHVFFFCWTFWGW